MKAISLVKFFTLVGFLVLGVQEQAQAARDYANNEECMRKEVKTCVFSEYKKFMTSVKTIANGVETTSDSVSEGDAEQKCIKIKKELACNKYLSSADEKESMGSCKALLKEYNDSMKKTREECGRMPPQFGGSSDVGNEECRRKAKQCKRGLGAFGSEGDDGDSVAGAAVNLFGVYGQMQGLNNANGVDYSAMNGCLIDKDKEGRAQEVTDDDKITALRERMADLKKEASDADKAFSEKKEEVERDMADVEKDASEKSFAAQTKNQQNIVQIQKSIAASQKKRNDNISKMAEIQPKIAFLAFTQQDIVISMSDSAVTSACEDGVDAEYKKKTDAVIDPKSGKMVNPKFSLKESARFQKRLNGIRAQCYQVAANKKNKELKTLADQKRVLESAIKNLETENADEVLAIEREVKNMEAVNKIATEEEQKSIELKTKKLNSLNESVNNMARYTEEKKRSFAEKTQALQDKIDKVRQDKLNVASQFNGVSVAVETSGQAASTFMEECCSNTDPKQNHTGCARVIRDDTDKAPKGARARKTSVR